MKVINPSTLSARFEIEKKLRQARKKEQNKKMEKEKSTKSSMSEPGVVNKVSATQRSQDRRKVMESKKDTKKMSAFDQLKARREEKKKALGKFVKLSGQ